MSNFVPGNYDLRTALIFCYHLKKTAAEAYGEHALGKSQCFEWFNDQLNVTREAVSIRLKAMGKI